MFWRTSILALALATPAAFAQDLLQQLAQQSPFLPAAGANAGPAAESGQLELRSVVKQGGVLWFSVFDPTTNESQWIREDDRSNGFVVKSYDPATDTLVLDQGSRQLNLSLPRPEIGTSAPSMPQMVTAGPVPLPMPAGGNTQNATNATGPTPTARQISGGPTPLDAAGRERLLQEIRRRRAERLSQMQQQQQQGGGRPR